MDFGQEYIPQQQFYERNQNNDNNFRKIMASSTVIENPHEKMQNYPMKTVGFNQRMSLQPSSKDFRIVRPDIIS
jgi:hypothetical protein